jgi:hypothetical protein
VVDADRHALTELRTRHAVHRHDRSAHVRIHREIAAFLARRGRLLGALGHLALAAVARFA